MLGKMMSQPLTIRSTINRAGQYRAGIEVVSVEPNGDPSHTTWGAVAQNARRFGSALPLSMIPAFRDKYGAEPIHAWGMTGISPLGSLSRTGMSAPS